MGKPARERAMQVFERGPCTWGHRGVQACAKGPEMRKSMGITEAWQAAPDPSRGSEGGSERRLHVQASSSGALSLFPTPFPKVSKISSFPLL